MLTPVRPINDSERQSYIMGVENGQEGENEKEEAAEKEINDEISHEGEDEEENMKGLSQDGLRPDPQEERRVNKNTNVYQPTEEEKRNHERTHCPFKPWCKHCVRGRAYNSQHRKTATNESPDEKKRRCHVFQWIISL